MKRSTQCFSSSINNNNNNSCSLAVTFVYRFINRSTDEIHFCDNVEIWIVAEIDHLDIELRSINLREFFSLLISLTCFVFLFPLRYRFFGKPKQKWTDINIVGGKKWIYKLLTFNVQNWLFICYGSKKHKAHKTIHWASERKEANHKWCGQFYNLTNFDKRKWLFRELIAFNHLYRTSRLMNVDSNKHTKTNGEVLFHQLDMREPKYH